MTGKRKFLWAVDAFAEERAVQEVTFRTLEELAAATGASIEPVAVLSPEQLRIPASVFEGVGHDYRLEAEKRLVDWCGRLRSQRLEAPRILAQPRLSLGSTVDTLLEYAREARAELIGIGTTTSKAWERLFLGSFAETTMLRSEIPLLVTNPNVVTAGNLKRLLFATDLSEPSRAAFSVFLRIAKALKAEVVVYTKSEYVLPLEGTPAHGLLLNYLDYVKLDVEARRKGGQPYLDEAKRAGVAASLLVDNKVGTTSTTILEAAKQERIDLIAMASRSGAITSTVLGSVTRNVARTSPLPVWVIHPASD